ncbi:hypothetical protein SFA35_15205 [Pseudomonas sp. HR96]|uniref:hypothetical protein n=1 Tax=Pseudomonas sp. HR96 TaxID=1027966 RepID=UPI002A760FA0|nr:hypothetical protein [Pseudomonas sp. HR96]WPO97997.1 hypothetical protein SFA35_15205 [Pseudomonas sp. HR96]
MSQESLESLELSQRVLANRKTQIESDKLQEEIKKLRREGKLYPVVVMAGLLTAIVALFKLLLS